MAIIKRARTVGVFLRQKTPARVFFYGGEGGILVAAWIGVYQITSKLPSIGLVVPIWLQHGDFECGLMNLNHWNSS